MNRKLKDITIVNFQGHRNNKLELHENLNSLIGPSGAGKSTILKALSWVYADTIQGVKQYGDSIYSHRIKGLTKKGNPTFLEDTSVEVTFTDGHIIKKIAGNNPTYYEVTYPDGELKTLTAIGRGVPEQVQDIFNFKDMNYSTQWEPYYLLFESDSAIASKLEEYTDMTLPTKILKSINSQTKKANSKLKVIEEDIIEKTEELKDYEKVEIMKKALDKLQIICNNKEEVNEDLEYLIKAKDNLELFDLELKKYTNLDKLEKALKELMEFNTNVSLVSDELIQIESCLDDWEYLDQAFLKFNNLDSLVTTLEEIKLMRRDLDAMDNSLESMLFDKDSLISLSNSLAKYDNLDLLEKKLKDIAEVSHTLLPLEEMIISMEKDMRTARELTTSLKQLDEEILVLEKELEGTVCPLCGNKKEDCNDK